MRTWRRGVARSAVLATAVGAAALLGSCSSTPDAAPPSPPLDAPLPPVATAPQLDALPLAVVTIGRDGDRVALHVDEPTTVAPGLVRLVVRNDVRDDPVGSGRGVVVLGPAPRASRADLEAALVSGPERIDELGIALGGSAPLAPGGAQEVVLSLTAGRVYLAVTGPGSLGSVASSTVLAAPLTSLDVGGPTSGSDGGAAGGSGAAPGTTLVAPPTVAPGPRGTVALGTVVPQPAPATQAEEMAAVTVGEITLSDYDVELPDEVRPGWYHVVNRGPQPHELAILAIDGGRSGSDVTDALEQRALAARRTPGTTPPGSTPGSAPEGGAGAPDPSAADGGDGRGADGGAGEPGTTVDEPSVPAQLHGGLASLSPGAEAWIHLDLGPGAYLAACDRPALLPDAGQSAADDLPHHTHGMAVFFRVG